MNLKDNFVKVNNKKILIWICITMKKICVIFGGVSSEHDISIITALQLTKNIKDEFDVEKIYFGLDGKFYLATKVDGIEYFENKDNLKLKEIYFFNNALFYKGVINKKICDIDCVINCCHGGVGENGDLSAFFSVLGIRYTNANCLASHIAMDKNLCKRLVGKIVPTIKGYKVTKNNFDKLTNVIDKKFSNNIIVKPNSLGSSIGVKVCNKEDYKDQVKAVFEMFDDALVEEQIVNLTEYNQACFKTEQGLVLSAIENPITKSGYLTFDDKYKNQTKTKGADRIIPAQISAELEEQIIDYTSKIYKTLNMNGVVRIDYIFDLKNNKLYFNEINTIPGSMAFYLYEPVGIDYISLVKQLIENATKPQQFKYFDTNILHNKKI